MARTKEIIKNDVVDGVMEIRLSHWKHFPKLISRDLLEFPSYIFRGQASSVWKLESSYDRLIRKKKIRNVNIENHLNAFKNASKGRRGRNPQILENNDEWWALAQHNGLATPLLDFTRSAFVALYFAFWDETFTGKERAVYGLHYHNLTTKMNKLKDEDKKVKLFYPSSDENDRLINQSGLFIKMPIRTDLESFVSTHFKGQDDGADLFKIIIPNTEVKNCLIMLNKMNINHSTLFPDLYGAAKYVNCLLDKPRYDNIQHLNLDT
jgi:hypothetical protein